MTLRECEDCKEPIPADHEICRQCCEHDYDPDEGFMCLICGAEGMEDMMAEAYDRAKDLAKYGH